MQILSRLTLLTFIVLALVAPGWVATSTSSVTYTQERVNKIRAHVIWVNLNDKTLKVTPALARDHVGSRQSFISFLAQHQPLAQITGSYFDLRNARPIGDIVISGTIRHRGPVGTALAITPDNKATMTNIPYNWPCSWPGSESVIKGGMRLVKDGKYALSPRQQGFHDPGLFRPATRTAVGIDGKHRLLFVGVGREIRLPELAGVMKGLGCKDAMTLDGGTSTGLAYGSSVILTPGRTLSNVLMVVKRPLKPLPVTALAGVDGATITPARQPAPETSAIGPALTAATPDRRELVARVWPSSPPFSSVGSMVRTAIRSLLFVPI